MERIFPEVVKSFSHAPQHMKDLWFNEFKKNHRWEPSDESLIREIFEKKAKTRLSDNLGYAREKLREGKPRPTWMSDQVFAQYLCIWNTPEFKKTSEKNKNKKKRNSNCGGMGSYKHTGGSIPTYEHRLRIVSNIQSIEIFCCLLSDCLLANAIVVDQAKEDGVEPSAASVYKKTHTKKDGTFICPKSKAVMDTFTTLTQTQLEKSEISALLEAAGGP